MDTLPTLSFEDKVLVSDLPKIMKNANQETRDIYWKIIDGMFYFLRNIQAEHAGRDPSEITYPPVSHYTATISHADHVSPLVMENTDFTVGAYNYLVMMAEADSLESSMASLGQTREIINSLDDLAATRTYPLSAEKFRSPFKNELDFLAAKKWCERKGHQELLDQGGRQAFARAARDWPRDPAAQKAKAEELCQAALNEVNIVDNMWHGTEKNPILNHMIKKKRDMSALTLALFGWDATVAARDCQIGLPKVPMFASDFVYRMYGSFKERLVDVERLFRTSKAAVVNTLATPSLFKSVAQPYKAIKTKQTNKKNNKKRTDNYRAAREILARNTAATSTKTNENDPDPDDQSTSGEDGSAVDEELSSNSDDDSEDEGDECAKDHSNKENDNEEERDEVNEPHLNEDDDNHFEAHWDLVVQYLASQGEEPPVNKDVEGRIEYTNRVLQLMEDAAFMEMLQVEAAKGGVVGANEEEENIYDA